MDTPLTTAHKIEDKIAELEQIREGIFGLATRKAMASSNFSRQTTLNELKLKNGLITEFEGIPVGNITATTVRKIAEGIAWKEILEKDESEGMYKATIATMESIKAEMNGLQSINRTIE